MKGLPKIPDEWHIARLVESGLTYEQAVEMVALARAVGEEMKERR